MRLPGVAFPRDMPLVASRWHPESERLGGHVSKDTGLTRGVADDASDQVVYLIEGTGPMPTRTSQMVHRSGGPGTHAPNDKTSDDKVPGDLCTQR